MTHEHHHHIHVTTHDDAKLLGKAIACRALSYDDNGDAIHNDPERTDSLRDIARFIAGTGASPIEQYVLFGLVGELLAAYQGNALRGMPSEARRRLCDAYTTTHASLIEILALTNPGDSHDCPAH